MTQNEFLEFLTKCRNIGGKAGAAAILFELEKEESETNSQYSMAHRVVKDLLGEKYDVSLENMFQEIQQDENDHTVKFQKAGSSLIGIQLGNPNN